MSPAEEQLSIRGHGQRAGAEVHTRGKGALQEALGPGGEGHRKVAEPRVGWWHLWGPSLGDHASVNSLCIGDGGVFGEAEVVGDVLVVG